MIALGQKVTTIYEKARVLRAGYYSKYQYAVLADGQVAFRHYSSLSDRRLGFSRWRSAAEMTAGSLPHLKGFVEVRS